MGEKTKNPHDWMFDGRVMFCRKCFKNTPAPGRNGSQMDTECHGFGKVSVVPLGRSENTESGQ